MFLEERAQLILETQLAMMRWLIFDVPLKGQRQRLGLSRKKMAALLGIDESSLAHWERGEHPSHRKTAEDHQCVPGNSSRTLKLRP